MSYLKCSKCGHFNEVRTEFLVLCAGCNKKLEKNFTDWHLNNPDKSFNDFKNTVCVPRADVQNNKSKANNSKGIKYWVSFTIAFALSYVIGSYGGKAIINFLNSEITNETLIKLLDRETTDKEVLEKNWIKETYGNFGLTVETPVKMTKSDLPLPENIKQLIEEMDVYSYDSNKGFKVMINSIKYNPSVGKLNLEGAILGAINELKAHSEYSDITYNQEEMKKGETPGLIQKGKFKQSGIDVEFINTAFAKDLVLYQVMVAFQIDDETGRIAANKVIESIEIKDSPKEP